MATVAQTGEQNELSAMKRRLLEQRMRGGRAVVARIAAREPGTRVPVSTEQHRVWLHASMEPEVPIYNESLTVYRMGSFDGAVFEAAFNELLRRHEAWRTSFAMEGDALVQLVAPELHVSCPVRDLREVPLEKREAEACRIATRDAAEPIDMAKAPLLRARVLRMSDDEHRLQLTLHHIIFDGMSLYRTFMPELAAIYAAFEAGEDSPLAVPDLQYGDYTLWREEQLRDAARSPDFARQMEYWTTNLAGELPVLRLPVDRPRPAAVSHRGAMLCFQLPEELMVRLRGLSREYGVTLNMTMLAAFKTLLFRYSGQEDLIVGGLTDGRRRPELEGVMGYFLDTFAIRTRPRAETPFALYLREVSQTTLGALSASEVPFSRVVAAVQPARDHHPIFQTFLAFQPRAEIFAEGWELRKTDVEAVAAKFDLYVEVDERLDWTAVRLMYRTDLFEAPTIARMAGHWKTLLEGIVDRPEAALGELPMLTGEERETMLVRWNETARAVPMETLHGLVEAQAKRTPGAVAVTFEGARWNYAELEREAERLAEQLRRAGAGRGTLVAVCLERTPWLTAALLAILKTGAAYLPLDPGTPTARRGLCLEDALPAVMLTERALLGDVPGLSKTAARVVVLEEALAATAPVWEPNDEAVCLNDAAYVIHTSGSTGRPKGVEISHRAVVNLLTSMASKPGFGAADVLLAVTTVSFDISVLELFLPLVTGGTCAIAPRSVALDPVLLAEAVERTGCTVLQATPSTWRALLGSGWRGRKGLRALCGGEAMTRDLADGLLALQLEVWNVYGPTETTIWSTVHKVTAGGGTVPVGRPIANTTAYILDPRQQPVPIGVAGELYLGGMGLATGYRGQPELTAAKFVVPDWSEKRLYRTGDYALYRADGTIEVQGRADNQIKVRGYRIELEDVESALMGHPEVGVAAAKAWPDAAGGHRLSGYLVGKAGLRPPDAAELREFLKTRVPEYMIPSDVVALETMPLTPNGKMDRKALAAPAMRGERVVTAAPETGTERRLAAIWAELLRVGPVGMEENFFDLGGHSLLVARLQRRIAEEFGRRLPMAALYHAPTLRRQVAMLAGPSEAPLDPRILAIQAKGIKRPLFWLEPTPLIANLSAAMGEERPLLGVTLLHGDLDDLGPEPGLETIARCYVDTIVRAHPGPYLLGGLCVGGILAYEVATQLTELGHAVESLVMLDAENPVFYRRFDSLGIELAKIRFYAERALFGNGTAMFWRHVVGRTRRLLRLDGPASTEMSEIGNVILAAALRYSPPTYARDVLLVLPRERPSVVDYVPGWTAVVEGKLICVEVDGHHDELLMPSFSGGIAEAVRGHLAQAEGVLKTA